MAEAAVAEHAVEEDPPADVEVESRVGPRVALGLAAGAFVLGLVAITVAGSLVGPARSDGSLPARAADATPAMLRTDLTVTNPPAEWAADGLWKTPPLLEAAGRVVVVNGDAVGLVTARRQVAVVQARSGNVLWSKHIPAGAVHSGLALTTVAGEAVLALHVGDQLAWWAVDDGTAGSVSTPAASAVTYTGQAPLVVLSDSEAAIVSEAGEACTDPEELCGELHRVRIPAGAVGYAAHQGRVVAAGRAGWWRLAPGAGAGDVTAWPAPDTLPVAWVGGQMLTIQAVPGKVACTLTVLDGSGMAVAWSQDITVPGSQVTWRPSPTREWGILGRTLVDLRGRLATDLGQEWASTAIAADRAMGTYADQRVLVGPSIPIGVMADREGFPEDLVRLERGQAGALVRGADHSVYLLPPEDLSRPVPDNQRPEKG